DEPPDRHVDRRHRPSPRPASSTQAGFPQRHEGRAPGRGPARDPPLAGRCPLIVAAFPPLPPADQPQLDGPPRRLLSGKSPPTTPESRSRTLNPHWTCTSDSRESRVP